jgi:hypothetical protein
MATEEPKKLLLPTGDSNSTSFVKRSGHRREYTYTCPGFHSFAAEIPGD